MDWESWLFGILVVVFYRVWLWMTDREVVKVHKYKFECPMCDFRVYSNDKEHLTRAQIAHHHNLITSKNT